MLYFTKLFLTSIFIINVETVIASEAKTGLPQLDLNTYPSLVFWSIISPVSYTHLTLPTNQCV